MTIFSKIIRGEIPSYKVAEDDKFYAFLDINPVQQGHTLVVPKREEDYIFDLSDEELGEMMVFAKRVAGAIKEVTECKKVSLAVVGLEVPHAHIHLIPINSEGDLDFTKARVELTPEEMQELAKKLQEALYNTLVTR
ncbi:MAG: HIT family protein [Porphyromonas sp.]|nr:HIT family protein [Porphyromonas sp.]